MVTEAGGEPDRSPLHDGGGALPRWFTSSVFVAIIATGVCGTTGTALLALGLYHPSIPVVLAVSTVAVAWRRRPTAVRSASRSAHVAAAAAVGLAAVALVTSLAFRSEHLLTDRDPGVYVNSARSIARTHEIQPRLPASPFDDRERYTLDASGFAVRDLRLLPNFMHFLPAVLATGHALGGDGGLLAVPPLLAALGVLVAHALATQVTRAPAVALLVPLLLVVSPLQWWFARDAYSELPVQVLAVGGLWLWITARREESWFLAVAAGFAIGCTALARPDALAAVVGIPFAWAVLWAIDKGSPRLRRTSVGFAIALAACLVASRPIGREISRGYVTTLADEHRRLELALGASVLLAAVLVAFAQGPLRRAVGSARGRVAGGAAAAVVVAGAAWAWFVRPRPRAELPVRDPGEVITAALRSAITHWHWSYSLRWFGWYLGAAAVAAAVAGWALLVRRAARADVPALLVSTVALPVTALYLWRPSISPDHFWAMRRFLPVVWPVAAIAIAVAADTLVRAGARHVRLPVRLLVAATLAVVVVVPAAHSGRGLHRARTQHGALDAVTEVCAAVPPDGAVLVLSDGVLGITLPPAIRGFCGVPVASTRRPESLDLAGLAREWRAQRRRLFVVAGGTASIDATGARTTAVAVALVDDRYEPERSRDHVPRTFAPRPQRIVVHEVVDRR